MQLMRPGETRSHNTLLLKPVFMSIEGGTINNNVSTLDIKHWTHGKLSNTYKKFYNGSGGSKCIQSWLYRGNEMVVMEVWITGRIIELRIWSLFLEKDCALVCMCVWESERERETEIRKVEQRDEEAEEFWG